MKTHAFRWAMALIAAAPPAWCQAVEVAPDPVEPDYATVAQDARKIANEIEDRLIENDMADAKSYLSQADAALARPKAAEAYEDMKSMIKFCEATQSGAGSACRFKLGIKMSLNPGQTLGQMKAGLGSKIGGMGMGMGGSGGSSAQRFGMFGPQPFGQPSQQASRIGDKKAHSQTAPNGAPDPLAGNVEELQTQKRDAFDVTAESGAPILQEYRPLIEAYFKRLAEEESTP